jgi:RimJ/RimL family protein N-acetyltransferase
MSSQLILRPATLADAECLLAWRNDPATCRASHNPSIVQRDEHISWLHSVLADPGRRLLIAEQDGIAVGSVRADSKAGHWVLSWTIAPAIRGKGIGSRMVALFVQQIGP